MHAISPKIPLPQSCTAALASGEAFWQVRPWSCLVNNCANPTIPPGCNRSHVPQSVWLSVQLCTAIFASTLHAQDFRDVSGDLMMGRRTLPIVVPLGSRISIAFGIPLWSVFLSRVWGLDPLSTTAFVSYSAYTGARFLLYRSLAGDRRSCDFYSVSYM